MWWSYSRGWPRSVVVVSSRAAAVVVVVSSGAAAVVVVVCFPPPAHPARARARTMPVAPISSPRNTALRAVRLLRSRCPTDPMVTLRSTNLDLKDYSASRPPGPSARIRPARPRRQFAPPRRHLPAGAPDARRTMRTPGARRRPSLVVTYETAKKCREVAGVLEDPQAGDHADDAAQGFSGRQAQQAPVQGRGRA